MGLTRSLIVKGPAKIVLGGISYWTPDDISLDLDDGIVDVKSAMFGPRVDGLVINPKVNLSFTPHAMVGTGPAEVTRAAALAALIPAIFTNGFYGTQYIGSGSETPCVIWSTTGERVTIHNAVITKPPSVSFAADKPIFGSVSITGICKTTSSDINLGAANSLYTIALGASDPGLAFLGVPSYLQRRYRGNLGSQSGFTEIWPEGGWTVDFTPAWKERQIQGLTVDYELAGMEIMVKGVLTGPTMKQILDLVAIGGDDGASWGQGRLASAQQATHSLVITDPIDGSAPFTLNKPQIRKPGFKFGHEVLRNGEIGFHSQIRFSTGSAVALATIA